MSNPYRLLTRKEVAEWLRVSVPTIDRLIACGDLTPKRVGKQRVFVTEGEVRRYLETC